MIGWKRENIDDKNYLYQVYFEFKRNMSLHCLPMKTIEESVVKIMFFGVIFPQLFYLDCWFIYFKWKTNTFKTFFIYITSMQICIKGYRLISCWTCVLPPWKVFRNISFSLKPCLTGQSVAITTNFKIKTVPLGLQVPQKVVCCQSELLISTLNSHILS